MRAPRKRAETQMVKIHLIQSLASRMEPNFVLGEVTNQVVPKGGMNQAVMQMNGLSPEILQNTEADDVHMFGRQNRADRQWLGTQGSVGVLDNGMVQDGGSVNLGDPVRSFLKAEEYARTSRKRRELENDAREVGPMSSTRSLGKPGTRERRRQNGNRLRAGMAAPQRVA